MLKKIAALLAAIVLLASFAVAEGLTVEEAPVQILDNGVMQCSVPVNWTVTENNMGWHASDPLTGYEYDVFSWQLGKTAENAEDLLRSACLFNGGFVYDAWREIECESGLMAYGETDVIDLPGGQMKNCCYATSAGDLMFCAMASVPADADIEMALVNVGTSMISSGEVETSPLYIGNKNTKKFHYAECDSVDDMKEKNKVELSSRDEAVEAGYVPCKRCNP